MSKTLPIPAMPTMLEKPCAVCGSYVNHDDLPCQGATLPRLIYVGRLALSDGRLDGRANFWFGSGKPHGVMFEVDRIDGAVRIDVAIWAEDDEFNVAKPWVAFDNTEEWHITVPITGEATATIRMPKGSTKRQAYDAAMNGEGVHWEETWDFDEDERAGKIATASGPNCHGEEVGDAHDPEEDEQDEEERGCCGEFETGSGEHSDECENAPKEEPAPVPSPTASRLWFFLDHTDIVARNFTRHLPELADATQDKPGAALCRPRTTALCEMSGLSDEMARERGSKLCQRCVKKAAKRAAAPAIENMPDDMWFPLCGLTHSSVATQLSVLHLAVKVGTKYGHGGQEVPSLVARCRPQTTVLLEDDMHTPELAGKLRREFCKRCLKMIDKLETARGE